MTMTEHKAIREACEKYAVEMSDDDVDHTDHVRVGCLAYWLIEKSMIGNPEYIAAAALRVAAKVVSELAKDESR